jgi:hypothetical protein
VPLIPDVVIEQNVLADQASESDQQLNAAIREAMHELELSAKNLELHRKALEERSISLP